MSITNSNHSAKILVAGATGNLGGKIVRALLQQGASVCAIVRHESDVEKIQALKDLGVDVLSIDMQDIKAVTNCCTDVQCVVSALSGLDETIIDTQKLLLGAAVVARVPRFISSDFSIDFLDLIPGQNRNLDLRRKFHEHLDKAPIAATSIFNGAFMDLLTTDMPLILFKKKRILCWGDPDQKMEFTTTYNVAEYTAAAALAHDTPRYLHIAGDVLSCNQFVALLTELTQSKYRLFRPGGIWLLNIMIKLTRFFSPASQELYPAWQGMQYMRDMMEGRVKINTHDNNKYGNVQWTDVKEFLKNDAGSEIAH